MRITRLKIGKAKSHFEFLKWKTFFLLLMLTFFSCSYDKGETVSLSDAALLDLIKSPAGYTYYKNNTDTLLSDPSSPHDRYARIRFNSIAAAAMNNDLSNLGGSRFPDGSIIVKELYPRSGGNLSLWAAMFKTSVDNNTGGGWVWGEYRLNGDILFSTSQKGVGCISCHSAAGNVDLVRTFSLH